jgi:hypothetical protein
MVLAIRYWWHTLELVTSAKYLGLTITNKLQWDQNVHQTCIFSPVCQRSPFESLEHVADTRSVSLVLDDISSCSSLYGFNFVYFCFRIRILHNLQHDEGGNYMAETETETENKLISRLCHTMALYTCLIFR